jgi:hypothetical protein
MLPVGKGSKVLGEVVGEAAAEGSAAAKRAVKEEVATTAARPGDVLEALAAQPQPPAPRVLTLEELQPWVGVPDVVVRVFNAYAGRVEVAAGEIESMAIQRSAPSYEALLIKFKHLDPELIRGKLQGTEVPHISSKNLHLKVGGNEGVISIGRAADQALSETRPQRLRLRGRAAEITEGLTRGEYVSPFELSDPARYATSSTGRGVWLKYSFPPEFKDALLKEQNALFSVILEKVGPRIERGAVDSASVDALFAASRYDGALEDPFSRLTERTARALADPVYDLHIGSSPAQAELAPALKGVSDLLDFRRTHEIGRRFTTPYEALTTGLTTLKLNTANLARVVPDVWALRKPGVPMEAAQLATVHRNSRRLLDQMASSDIGLHVIDDLRIHSFGDGPLKLGWDPAFFELVGEGEHQALAFTDDFIRAFKAEHGAWMNTPLASATGCPALTAGILSSFSRRLEPGLEALYERVLPKVETSVP